MKNVTYFKDLFESITVYQKIVLLTFLIQIDDELLTQYGVVKTDIERLNLKFKNIL